MPLPPIPPAFYWSSEQWGHALRCRPLESVAPHVFTTRQLALTASDALSHLAQSVNADAVAMATQVHQADVAYVRAGQLPWETRPDADILVSDNPSVAIGIRAADCVPLLIADRRTGTVAAVHAGWRGTAARAAVVAVHAMQREFASRPEDLLVAIGPSIGSCCYQVGTELVDAFAAAGHERHLIDRWFLSPSPGRGWRGRSPVRLDLPGANRDQLVLEGIPEAHIYLAGLCTAMHLDLLTSFRAERESAGRIAGAIRARQLSGTVSLLR